MGMTRSEQMSRVKGQDTKPEIRLRSALWASGLRYRLNVRVPPARPDIVFPGSKVAVFIDGCFWHGCPAHYVTPRTRRAFWADKLAANVERDMRHTRQLEEKGWRVMRILECEVEDRLDELIAEVREFVLSGKRRQEPRWRIFRADPLDEAGDFERRYLVDIRQAYGARQVEGRRNSRSGPWVPGAVGQGVEGVADD